MTSATTSATSSTKPNANNSTRASRRRAETRKHAAQPTEPTTSGTGRGYWRVEQRQEQRNVKGNSAQALACLGPPVREMARHTMSGASHKRKGTRREHQVVEMLTADGWMAFRSMGSLGPADVLAMRAGSRTMLIQVKAGNVKAPWSRFPPADRQALSIMARRAGADAVACFWADRALHPLFIYEKDWLPLGRGRRPTTPDYAVDKHGCWIWLKTISDEGYGVAGRYGKRWLAHRLYYTDAKGEIPPGLQIDHLCRVRSCVNPDHLEAVTQQMNIQRSPVTKLTADEVRAIRKDPRSPTQIARDYGLTRGWVHRLKTREKRADVSDNHAVEEAAGERLPL